MSDEDRLLNLMVPNEFLDVIGHRRIGMILIVRRVAMISEILRRSKRVLVTGVRSQDLQWRKWLGLGFLPTP